MKIQKTLSFMARNPIPFMVQLVCWFLYAGLIVEPEDSPSHNPWSEDASIRNPWLSVLRLTKTSLSDLPESLENFAIIVSIIFDEVIIEVMKDGGWVFIFIPVFIISYREAKGNLKGIAKERQIWMQWYDRQPEVIRHSSTLQEPPSTLAATQANSYFRKAQKTALSMVRNPIRFVLHFACWATPLILLFIVDWATGIQTAPNFLNFLPIIFTFAAIPALISCYQETRGIVKGIAKEGEVWSKWHQRQIKAIADGYPVASPPPSLNIF